MMMTSPSVGDDAWAACFAHPDGSMRSMMMMSSPISRGHLASSSSSSSLVHHHGHHGVRDGDDLTQLIRYLLRKTMTMLNDDHGHHHDDDDDESQSYEDEYDLAHHAQVLFAYKVSFSDDELRTLADSLFGSLQCSKVCFLNETSLALSAAASSSLSSPLPCGVTSVSAVVVDMGATLISVLPCYEGIVMRSAMRTTALGGEMLTDFMESMLDAQALPMYSSAVPRRRKLIARDVKESCAFIASDFSAFRHQYGDVSVTTNRHVNIFTSAVQKEEEDEKTSLSSYRDEIVAQHDITVVKEINPRLSKDHHTGSDTPMTVRLTSERFYCPEILFRPELFVETEDCQSLVEVILESVAAVDESVRDEICSVILLCGGSSRLPGLSDRLHSELQMGMSELGVNEFAIRCLENPESQESAVLRGCSVRMRLATSPDAKERVMLEQENVVLSRDYETMGSAYVPHILIG